MTKRKERIFSYLINLLIFNIFSLLNFFFFIAFSSDVKNCNLKIKNEELILVNYVFYFFLKEWKYLWGNIFFNLIINVKKILNFV